MTDDPSSGEHNETARRAENIVRRTIAHSDLDLVGFDTVSIADDSEYDRVLLAVNLSNGKSFVVEYDESMIGAPTVFELTIRHTILELSDTRP